MTRASYDNLLLQRLSDDDLALLAPLTTVDLTLRQQLHAANTKIEFAYFPEHCLASVVSEEVPGVIEVGIIGVDGMTGVALAYGDVQSPFECFVQGAGTATRVDAHRLSTAIATSGTLRQVMLNFANAFATQVAATSIANGRGLLEERLARWLLMVADRMGTSFSITHEFLATMLAVRRSGVTLGLQALEGRGLIRSTRGSVTLLDRDGLVGTSNGSYGLAEREYARLFKREPEPTISD
ncbi:MAG: cyclic nucleotide-binding protein [Devosia sp.]|nr:cyclic nucleotide-binding protein [Devosia sp.]